MNGKKNLIFGVIICICLHALSFGFAHAAIIDMRDMLHSWYKENEKKGSLEDFPKGILGGDLYGKAYALSQRTLAEPALKALDLTYDVIEQRCGGKDIKARDITAIFAQSTIGEQFHALLDARDMTSSVQDASFTKSCMAVYTCYNQEALLERKVDLKSIKYSQDAFWSCTSTVNDIFLIMYQRAAALDTMKIENYGDDFLMNAEAEDGPFDLLLDAKAIGDILFAQNDPPSEIHYYNSQPLQNYVSTDPGALSGFSAIKQDDKERLERLPVTNGIAPTIPEKVTQSFPNKQDTAFEKNNNVSPSETPLNAQELAESVSPALQNQLCAPEPTPQPTPKDMLTLAEQENKQTEEYNSALDLDTQVAVLLGSKMLAEEEEKLGVFPRGKPPEEDGGDFSDEAKETANEIIETLVDTAGDTLEDTQEKIKQCAKQFTRENPQSRPKILLKSLTQPAEFTQCVFGNLCKEIGDPTGRGMFRIKICKQLQRGSGMVRQQSIKSIEEVIDEMNNVCTNLRSSGALLEHNKTKDHLEDKLMRIKFADKFSFQVSVFFKGNRDQDDPAAEKLKAANNRSDLEQIHLNITNNLTFVEDRNKYLIIQNKGVGGSRNGFGITTPTIQNNKIQLEEIAKYSNALHTLSQKSLSENVLAQQRQKETTAEVIDTIGEFVNQNIQMWTTANQMTDSLNKRRDATLRLYQASPN